MLIENSCGLFRSERTCSLLIYKIACYSFYGDKMKFIKGNYTENASYHLINEFEEVLGTLPFGANHSCFLAYEFVY